MSHRYIHTHAHTWVMSHTDSGPSVKATLSFTQTHAHTQWCVHAAELLVNDGALWLNTGSVFSQVNLLNHSQQQQTLKRPLVWVQLHSAGRVAAKIIWSETCCYRFLSWICRYCVLSVYVCGILHLFYMYLYRYGLMHGFFQQRPASHTLIHSVTHIHTW